MVPTSASTIWFLPLIQSSPSLKHTCLGPIPYSNLSSAQGHWCEDFTYMWTLSGPELTNLSTAQPFIS